MKTTLITTLILILLVLAGSAYPAPGPTQISGNTAAWNQDTDARVTGYYLYWVAGTPTSPAWKDAQRSGLIPQSAAPTYNLLTLGLPDGTYTICVTAVDAKGDESGASNTVPFVGVVLTPPGGLVTK
jgi:hypothetical protein